MERAGFALPLAVQARHSRSLPQLCHSALKGFPHAREYPECERVAIQGNDTDNVFTERQCKSFCTALVRNQMMVLILLAKSCNPKKGFLVFFFFSPLTSVFLMWLEHSRQEVSGGTQFTPCYTTKRVFNSLFSDPCFKNT